MSGILEAEIRDEASCTTHVCTSGPSSGMAGSAICLWDGKSSVDSDVDLGTGDDPRRSPPMRPSACSSCSISRKGTKESGVVRISSAADQKAEDLCVLSSRRNRLKESWLKRGDRPRRLASRNSCIESR